MKLSDITFNVPNLLSLSRIVLIPLFIYLLSLKTMTGWIWALVVFVFASFTDLLDGWSARRLNQESEFGRFFDPLADKFLVISALIAVIAIDPYFEIFDLWMILVIAGRDVMITVMRYLAIRRGTELQTSHLGKFKTAFQMASVVIIIMIYMVRRSGVALTDKSIPYWIMLGVTVLTAISGARYLFSNWRLFWPVKQEHKDRAGQSISRSSS